MRTSEVLGVKVRTKADILNFDKVLLWGAGSTLKDCADAIGRDNILAVFDNNPQKWNKIIHGFTIFPPSEFSKYLSWNVAVVISTAKLQYEISQELIGGGVNEEQLFGSTCYAHEKFRYVPQIIDKNYDAIRESINLLGDEQSKTYYTNFIKFALTRNPQYLKDNPFSTSPYEYKDNLIGVNGSKVILDCGAFDGDTAKFFLKQTDGDCEIYCFEPVSENYQKLITWTKEGGLNNVHLINTAVGDHKYREFVFSSDYTGTIGNDFRNEAVPSNEIEVDTLDALMIELERIDYIKFDVEGFEMPALRGAQALIRRHRPKMLVSAYHKVTDMWEVPQFVTSLCPEYKLFLGHQPNAPYEPEVYFTL